MEAATIILPSLQAVPYATPAVVGGGLFFSLYFINKYISNQRRRSSNLPPVPEVPGWPVIGNLLQLKEKKPHKTFKTWADTYGPIYSIKTGVSTIIVLNSTEVAKEAMVTRYSSISARKLSKSLTILTQDKCMVAMSDYDDFHKMVKRYILANVLGPAAQKQHRSLRDTMMENLSSKFHEHVENHPQEAVNFREIFESELFGISLKEALGTDVESIYVPELATTFSRAEIFQTLVLDPMEGAIEVDWRDFFPYLAWVPNRSWEMKIERMQSRRQAVMNALMREQKKRIASGKAENCYVDYLLSEAKTLTEKQILMLLWETIIEAADTTLVTTEWAMSELAKHPQIQDRLYHHIRDVCGSQIINEEHLPQLPYLNAIFHETLRKHSPVPVVPLRYAHEDTQLGGCFVPAGSQIAINIYGCNMDKNQWDNPEEWRPERFLDNKYDPMDLHKTMAFGAGKRVCAGALQATLIGSRAIGRLIQEFEWTSKVGEIDNVDTMALTSRKLYPFHAIVKRRAA